jgi:hypothetical protein
MAAIRSLLRRRKSPVKLYWRLERPGPSKYVRAMIGVILCRAAAAVAAILAIALFAFLGVVAGNMSYPRWPTIKSLENGQAISLAATPAAAELSRWVPVFTVFGLILVSIPRAHLWIFRLTMLSGVVLGYYQRRLPPFPQSTATTEITRRAALLTNWMQLHLASLVSRIKLHIPVPLVVAVVSLIVAVVMAYILYRSAYIVTVRTMSFVPRHQRSHNHSAFCNTSLARRLIAVPVAAGLLSLNLWILQHIRSLLTKAHYGVFLFGYSPISVIDLILLTLAVAVMICTPRPRGYRRLLVAIIVATTVYALSAHVHPLLLPTWTLTSANSFWILIVSFLFVTGFGFDLLTALLDWPIYVAFFARRWEQQAIPL